MGRDPADSKGPAGADRLGPVHDPLSGSEALRVVSERRGEALVLRVSGELDLSTAPVLDAAVSAAREEQGPPVVLDLSGVSFVDSTGIRSLIGAAQALESEGRAFALLSPADAVVRVLDLTDLRVRFHEIENLEPATLSGLRNR